MKKTILKKDLFNYRKLNEFVDSDANFIDDKMPDENSEEVYTAPGQTMDKMVKQTRQPGKQWGFFGSQYPGAANASKLYEMDPNSTDDLGGINASVVNSANELISNIMDNNLDSNQKRDLLNYIYNTIQTDELQ